MKFCHSRHLIVLISSLLSLALAENAYKPLDTPPSNSQQLCLTKIRSGNGKGKPITIPTRFSTSTTVVTVAATGRLTYDGTYLLASPIPFTAATTFRLDGSKDSYPSPCTSTISTLTIGPTQTIYTGLVQAHQPSGRLEIAKVNRIIDHKGRPFGNFRHAFGHALDISRQHPYQVDCIVHETATITGTTVNTASTVPWYDISALSASEANQPSSCAVTIGTATATTTQHIKCAPSNLVSSVNGHGINALHGWNSFALTPASDASACCQLCVETTDCAASETDLLGGNCFLWFTDLSNHTCGLAIEYGDGGIANAPGSGFVIQTGCGSIRPV